MLPPDPWRPPAPLPSALATPRLALRFLRDCDAPSLLAAIDADRSAFLPWITWAVADNRTVAECVFHIERFRRQMTRADPTPDDFMIGIIDRASGEVLGGTGFHRIDLAAHTAEIGYWVRADRRRQGICTEAIRAMLNWGFSPQSVGWGFRRIVVCCSAGNEASASVPRKLGMREEARFVRDRWVHERGWDDSLEFGLLADEWDVAAGARR